MSLNDSGYRGRFAPSPTGSLHFGSLYTAVASFLEAKSQQGQWLLRIDDLDRSRCKNQHTTTILHTLEQYGLEWDEAVFYQSTRHNAYLQALGTLKQLNLLYPCQCSRKNLADRHVKNGLYDGYCLTHTLDSSQHSSLRIKLPNTDIVFIDNIQGKTTQNLQTSVGDFVMLRKDKTPAYHLAVVLDDQAQGITHVLRGHDLLDSTYRQIHLQHLLEAATPSYAHIPVISDLAGAKLSKQTYADDVSLSMPRETLINVLTYLNLNPPTDLVNNNPNEILKWGVEHWSLANIQPQASILFKQ